MIFIILSCIQVHIKGERLKPSKDPNAAKGSKGAPASAPAAPADKSSESKLKFTLLKKAVDKHEEEGHNKFEALSLCYANRSAALRRLCQYEDCLRDIARAARFGYPKENMFKLWERKAKCYFGLKRYELAAKCLRQSLNALKESGLSDLSKASKTTELQVLLYYRKAFGNINYFFLLRGS